MGTTGVKTIFPAYFWFTGESKTANRVYFNEAALPVYLPELHTLAFIKVLLVTHDALQLHLQDTSGEENNKLAIFLIFLEVKQRSLLGELVPVPHEFHLLLPLDLQLLKQPSPLPAAGLYTGSDALQLLTRRLPLRPEGVVTPLRLLHLLFGCRNLGVERSHPLRRGSDTVGEGTNSTME